MNTRPFILLVEDNEDDIALTRRALARVGADIELVVAKDGEEGLDACRAAGAVAEEAEGRLPLFILLDLKLPKAGGLEIFHCFKHEPSTKDIPIILVSSSKEEVALLERQGLGAHGYHFKPLTPEDLKRYLALRSN